MNGSEVAENLERFINGNSREWFGVSAIQRDCRVSYNQGCRIIDLGIKQGIFEEDPCKEDPRKKYRLKMAR